MTSPPLLKVGQRLEIIKPENEISHFTRIEEVGTSEFAICQLYGGAEAEVLKPGEEVDCCFSDSEVQAQYGFRVRVLRREIRKIPLYFLSMPTNFTRIQRRGFVRLPVLIPQLYRLPQEESWHKGYLLDLSGGGARISHRDPLALNSKILLQFSLRKDESPLILTGRVVRSERAEAAGPPTYHTGVEFCDMSVSIQDRIVGYVFERMLSRRQGRED